VRRPPWPLVFVWLGTLAVFLPALRGEYVDDDLELLRSSPTFAGIAHLWDAIRAPFWGTDLGYWRPLTSALMCIGHALGSGHPWVTHAFALLAHLLAATLAFAILRRLDVATKRAAFAAAVFALHPCQVESVAWVAALGDPLAGAGTLGAVYGWIAWRQKGSHGWPLAACLGLGLALAAKESGLMALGWVVAADVALRVRGTRGPWRAGALGLGLVCAMWFVLRVLVFGDVRAGFDRGQLDVGAHGAHGALLRLYLATSFVALPTGWLAFTPYRWIPPEVASLARALALPAGLTCAALLAAWSAARGRRDVALLGALGMCVAIAPATLLPASLGPWPLADRYLYTASFGVAAVLVGSGRCRLGLAAFLVVVSACASALAVRHWRTHAGVVARALADCPQHPEGHFLHGHLERETAEAAAHAGRMSLAHAHHAAALAAYQRTLTYLQRPLYAGAHLRAVLGLNAQLGAAIAALGGNLEPVAVVRERVLALAAAHPDSAQVQLVLGVVHATASDFARAEAAWLRALALDPASQQAQFNLDRLRANLPR
jgi:hypothetical protein